MLAHNIKALIENPELIQIILPITVLTLYLKNPYFFEMLFVIYKSLESILEKPYDNFKPKANVSESLQHHSYTVLYILI